ncbi:MAG: hypothetical protein KKD44_12945 [Proteobacteria bacterium]|nr:hypothetical protein [Pseudomonadota bacterium]
MKHIPENTRYRTALAFMLALFLSACGGNGTPNTDSTPSYTGITDQAAITAGNALNISSKAMGAGFLDGMGSAQGGVTKSLTKRIIGPEDALLQFMGEAMGAASDTLYTDSEEVNLLPESMFESMDNDDFPNISGSYLRTVASDDEKTFTISHTFTQAVHVSGSAENRTKDTLNGVVTEIVTFDYADSDFSFENETLEQRFDILDDDLNPTQRTLTCNAFTHNGNHLWSPDYDTFTQGLFKEADGGGYGGLDGYDIYNETQEYVYTLDGDYSREEIDTDTMVDGLGQKTWRLQNNFEGSLDIRDHYLNKYMDSENTLTLSMAQGSLSHKLAEMDSAEQTDDVISTSSNDYEFDSPMAFSLPDCDLTLSLTGRMSLTYSSRQDLKNQEITIDLSNTAEAMVALDKIALVTSSYNADTHDAISNHDNIDTTITVLGNAAIDYAKTVIPFTTPVTQTITVSATSGKLLFTQNNMSDTQYITEDETLHTTYTIDNHQGMLLSGNLSITRPDDFLKLSGEITLNSSRNLDQRDGISSLNEESTLVTLNNLNLKSNTYDVSLQGTVENTLNFNDDSNFKTEKLNLIFSDNFRDKAYQFSDYMISVPDYNADKGSKLMATEELHISGRFFHPDYGYVDVTTGHTPFVMQFPYPVDGTLTVTGSHNSKAVLDVIYSEDETLAGYIVKADADGNGTFEAGPYLRYWPELDGPMALAWQYIYMSLFSSPR